MAKLKYPKLVWEEDIEPNWTEREKRMRKTIRALNWSGWAMLIALILLTVVLVNLYGSCWTRNNNGNITIVYKAQNCTLEKEKLDNFKVTMSGTTKEIAENLGQKLDAIIIPICTNHSLSIDYIE